MGRESTGNTAAPGGRYLDAAAGKRAGETAQQHAVPGNPGASHSEGRLPPPRTQPVSASQLWRTVCGKALSSQRSGSEKACHRAELASPMICSSRAGENASPQSSRCLSRMLGSFPCSLFFSPPRPGLGFATVTRPISLGPRCPRFLALPCLCWVADGGSSCLTGHRAWRPCGVAARSGRPGSDPDPEEV